MKLLKKMLMAALILLLFFLGMKKYKPSLMAVYPQQCIFLLDSYFSEPFQLILQDYVGQKYETCKNVEKILEDVSEKFSEVCSVDAYICKTDHMCFNIQARKPIFVLNEQVVCDNLKLVHKEHYQEMLISGLCKLTSSESLCVPQIAQAVKQIPPDIFEEFDIHCSDETILLSQKNKKSDVLFFSTSQIPTAQSIKLFKQIQEKNKARKSQTYDFRFKDQIIVK